MISISVNGVPHEAPDPSRNLLSYLRYDLGLTGTKYGCGDGVCGACTILVDGQPQRSCQATVGTVLGGSITTIEGLAPGKQLHPVQQAFIDHDAFQCGYCTPGQILSAVACIQEGHATDAASVREWMSGNLCRCATYVRIRAAIKDAARALEG